MGTAFYIYIVNSKAKGNKAFKIIVAISESGKINIVLEGKIVFPIHSI